MKKVMIFGMLLVILMGLIPASGEVVAVVSIDAVKELRFSDPGAEALLFTLTNNTVQTQTITIEVFDQAARQTVQTMSFDLLPGDAPYPVKAYVYKPLTYNGEVNTYHYTIKASGGLDKRLYYAQKLHLTKDSAGNEVRVYDQIQNVYYPRNTVSSFGPHFRDVTPKLTDKWYMFTPIDLTRQGRQTFVLAASNMYEVGEVYVDVSGDQVIVSYMMYHMGQKNFTTEVLSEFLNFYRAYPDVTVVEPEDMKTPSTFAFNRPFSIHNDLGGDTNVLMFVRNRINYYRFPAPKSEYIRFWENKDEYKALRDNMLLMMDPITPVNEAPSK